MTSDTNTKETNLLEQIADGMKEVRSIALRNEEGIGELAEDTRDIRNLLFEYQQGRGYAADHGYDFLDALED